MPRESVLKNKTRKRIGRLGETGFGHSAVLRNGDLSDGSMRSLTGWSLQRRLGGKGLPEKPGHGCEQAEKRH
ncbi:MAG: hypothetical protein AAGU11_14330 [Syntrophobacteraceae bacterium]